MILFNDLLIYCQTTNNIDKGSPPAIGCLLLNYNFWKFLGTLRLRGAVALRNLSLVQGEASMGSTKVGVGTNADEESGKKQRSAKVDQKFCFSIHDAQKDRTLTVI